MSYLSFEMTEISKSLDYVIRDAGNWYVHSQVLQGYTQENQILGANAVLGCDVQSLSAKMGEWLETIGCIVGKSGT